ncbi:uncharacterized protein LOC128302793 [Anopheles moucheti]|uniref:uncharacterized protein LOC128302793 n=1 Tax=Anopheles moucheti TaxID=186751 RepID=UPI0022F0CAA4|nr:uncharacterized protein LOC128302793 [Anopheles moucheti]
MEDPLNQRGRIIRTPTPQQVEASAEIKQEPELDMELLQQACSWDFNINDPLKEEIEIGETRVTAQDPLSTVQETAFKTQLKAEEIEDTEDNIYDIDSNTDMSILCDEIDSGGNINVINSPHLIPPDFLKSYEVHIQCD